VGVKVKGKTAEGQEVELELDPENLPAGLATKEHLQELLEGELGKRLSRAKKAALEEALKDEDFRTKALEAWGVKAEKGGKGGKPSEEELATLLEDLRKKEVAPLAEKLKATEGKLESLYAERLESEILAASEAVGVLKQFRRPLLEGSKPMIVAALRERFVFDPESGKWYERGANGEPVMSLKNRGGYRTVAETLEAWAEDKGNAEYLETRKPKGPGLGNAGGGRGGDVVLSRAEASDATKYREAEKVAAEQGGRVVVQG
jgi:hypothetical protein